MLRKIRNILALAVDFLRGNTHTPPHNDGGAPALISRDDSHVFKGVAILLMIAHHAFGCGIARIPIESPLQQIVVEHAWLAKICAFGNVCVSIFLFVTGLGVALSAQKPLAETMKKSLFRFWKMYLPCVLIGGLLLMFFSVDYPNGKIHSAGLKEIALALLGRGGKVCGEWWYASLFLTALIVYFPICRAAFAKFGGGGARNALLCAGMLAVWIGAALLVGGKLPYWSWAPAFVLGYLAGTLNFSSEAPIEFLRRFREKNYVLRAAVVALVCALSVVCILLVARCPRVVILPAVLFAAWALAPAETPGGKILVFLGKYSGWMWLNHSFFLYYYFRHELFSLGDGSALVSVPAVFFATTALSLGAAIAMKFLFDSVERIFRAAFVKA